jgi:hypothetical protein
MLRARDIISSCTSSQPVDAGIATVTASNVAGFFRECMRNISKLEGDGRRWVFQNWWRVE